MSTQTHTEKYADFKAIEEHREGYHEPYNKKTTRRDNIVEKVNENFNSYLPTSLREEYWMIEFSVAGWVTPNDKWLTVINTAMFGTEQEADNAFEEWANEEFCEAEWINNIQVIHIKKNAKKYTWKYEAEYD